VVAILNLALAAWTGYCGTDGAGWTGAHPIKNERITTIVINSENILKNFLFIHQTPC
jgi:hypothetical protein